MLVLSTDLRYAVRQLIRRPGHTVSIVACLVAGLVVSIGTFSVLNGLFFGELAGIEDRRSLARVFLTYDAAVSTETFGGERRVMESLSFSDYEVLRRLPDESPLESLTVEGGLLVTVVTDRGPVNVSGAFAPGDFF